MVNFKLKINRHLFKPSNRTLTGMVGGVYLQYTEITDKDLLLSMDTPILHSNIWACYTTVRVSLDIIQAIATVEGVAGISSSRGHYGFMLSIAPVFDDVGVLLRVTEAVMRHKDTAPSVLHIDTSENQESEFGYSDDKLPPEDGPVQ